MWKEFLGYVFDNILECSIINDQKFKEWVLVVFLSQSKVKNKKMYFIFFFFLVTINL